jgi:hypothetical protein
MVWLFTVLGLLAIAGGLNDMFHTLLRPSGRGRLSHLTASTVWRICRHSRRTIRLAGPLAVVCVIVVWTLLQTLGWALIYYPHIPQGFSYSPGITEARYPDAAEALYLSLVTLSTLGYGDVVAVDGWLRLFSPLQAVTGFALLTAAVSWFIQLYPALSRRRALALRLTQLSRIRYAQNLASLDPVAVSRTLESVATDVTEVRVSLSQNAETYYFWEEEPDISLPASIYRAFELCAEAGKSPSPAVRLASGMLENALDDLGTAIREQFALDGDTAREIFRSFSADHRRGPGTEAKQP